MVRLSQVSNNSESKVDTAADFGPRFKTLFLPFLSSFPSFLLSFLVRILEFYLTLGTMDLALIGKTNKWAAIQIFGHCAFQAVNKATFYYSIPSLIVQIDPVDFLLYF